MARHGDVLHFFGKSGKAKKRSGIATGLEWMLGLGT